MKIHTVILAAGEGSRMLSSKAKSLQPVGGHSMLKRIYETVQDITDEDRKIVGYFLNKPCIVKMQDPSVVDDTEDGKAQFSVALFPWMPLTKEDNIPIAADWLITMVEPIDKLKQMYIEDVVNYGKDNKGDSTDESPSTDSGD